MYNDIEFEYIPAEEYQELVIKPIEDGIYEMIVNLWGDLYERGYGGHQDGQALNIDNVFRTAAEELCDEMCDSIIARMEDLGAILIRPE